MILPLVMASKQISSKMNFSISFRHTKVQPTIFSYCICILFFLLSHTVSLYAQTGEIKNLYKQTSEIADIIIQYRQDIRAIKDFYSPVRQDPNARGGNSTVINSPEQRKRLVEVNTAYLATLEKSPFSSLSIYGKVDYVLLKRDIEKELKSLSIEEAEYKKITVYIPFADSIYAIEKSRRRGKSMEGQQVAALLDRILKDVKISSSGLKSVGEIEMREAETANAAVKSLQARLKNFFDFYMGYDPLFTWWVPEPYKVLNTSLETYAKEIIAKGKITSTQKDDGSGIVGYPIGRDELIVQLELEMIPYTPEQLIEIANKEFEFCDREMLKASREMGFGDNWKKALEKVKNTYVEAGKQPELILKLYDDAISFIKKRDLITIPPLAEETWGMIMMTPERQLVNPFFTGGRDISISYPTNTMAADDKMMSMRGNNPYFSRGTVQHELIPGHNLQFFMNSRHKSYRAEFRTPFWSEGWALYWELLLYEKGFAQTPEERIGMLFWRMHRCARIIFSLNYHLRKWTPQQAIDFLVDRVGHERANAEGEVRRSFVGRYSPLYQVAYLIGGLQFFALKKEYVDGGKMSFKQFHDAIMNENAMPVEMVRATLGNTLTDKNYKTSWRFYEQK